MTSALTHESIWNTGHPSAAICQPRGRTGDEAGDAIMLGRTYVVLYTDVRGQAQTERGQLVELDHDGFVVLEVNGKHLRISKARIDALVEVQ